MESGRPLTPPRQHRQCLYLTYRKRKKKLRETSEVAYFDALADLENVGGGGGGGGNPNNNRKTQSSFLCVDIFLPVYFYPVYYSMALIFFIYAVATSTLRGLLVCIVNAEKKKKNFCPSVLKASVKHIYLYKYILYMKTNVT